MIYTVSCRRIYLIVYTLRDGDASRRRMRRQERPHALDRRRLVRRALPVAQHLDLGREERDLLADRGRVGRVVAGHDEQRDGAAADEVAGDAEDEIAAVEIVVEALQKRLVELGTALTDRLRPRLKARVESL